MADLKADIKEAFAADPLGHLKRWFPDGKKERGRFRVGDIYGTKGRSLSIELNGDNPGMANDHSTGEVFGDVFDLYAMAHNYKTKGPDFKKMLTAMAEEFNVSERPNGKSKPNGEWHIAGEWTYYNPNGEPWCVVKRRDFENGGKDYRQYSPSGMPGRPDYAGKMPLYNLHELSTVDTVLVVEGEKCVETARELEIVATTSIGGQGQAQHSDWSPLAGKHVVLWPDVGAEGYAETVASLCESAASIRVVTPRLNAPRGWDIADAVAEGLDIEPFLRNAKPFQEAQEQWPNIFWVEDLDGVEPSTREFIIDQWLPRGHVTSLYGKGGSGKSLLAQQMANCVASGEMFFDCPVDSGPVIAVFAEDPKNEFHIRQKDICKRLVITPKSVKMCCICLGMRPDDQPDFRMIDFPINDSPNNNWPLTNDIEFLCKKIKPRLLVLDNIAMLFGGNENDRSQVTYWLNRLSALAQEHNMAILLIGHFRKGSNDFSGSTAWEAGVRSLCQLEAMGDDLGAPMRLERVKSNYAKRGAMVLKWDSGSFKLAGQMNEEEILEREAKDLAAETAVLAAIPRLNVLGQHTSSKIKACNRLDKVMVRFQMDDGLSGHSLLQALDKLIKAERIVVDQPIGAGKGRHKVRSLVVVADGGKFDD